MNGDSFGFKFPIGCEVAFVERPGRNASGQQLIVSGRMLIDNRSGVVRRYHVTVYAADGAFVQTLSVEEAELVAVVQAELF